METLAFTDALVSHAAASGYFDQVNKHEPKSAPGTGLNAAVWFETVGPYREGSGLNATTVRIVFTLRIYLPMLTEPQDYIDPHILEACDAMLAAYSGDFQLDGLIRNVDLLGESGTPLEAKSGYLDIDKTKLRVVDISIPLIVNDSWVQTP
jgi:hypothetical protein